METALKERATRMTPLEFQADRQDRHYRWRWPFDPIGESLIEHYQGAFTIQFMEQAQEVGQASERTKSG